MWIKKFWAFFRTFGQLIIRCAKNINHNQKCIAVRARKFEDVKSDGYRFKGNEEQHKHIVKVIIKLEDASKELQEHKVEEAQQKIAEGLDTVKNRKK